MILDSLENSGLYLSLHHRFKIAFDFLKNTDLLALPIGKIELESKNVFVIVSEAQGKRKQDLRVESHRKYLDIQLVIDGCETMGWKSSTTLRDIEQEYNPESDIAFYADQPTNLITLHPYEFAIFFPHEGHQPGIGVGQIKKIIVKVLF